MQVSLRSNCSAHSFFFFLRLDYQFVFFPRTRYSSDAASLDRKSLIERKKTKQNRDRRDDGEENPERRDGRREKTEQKHGGERLNRYFDFEKKQNRNETNDKKKAIHSLRSTSQVFVFDFIRFFHRHL